VGDARLARFVSRFNPQLRIECRGATVTSDAGLLLRRELAERLGLDALIPRRIPTPDLAVRHVYWTLFRFCLAKGCRTSPTGCESRRRDPNLAAACSQIRQCPK
jgi:hypothetical protein